MKEYNVTSYDRKVKTSINFPKELMEKAYIRMRKLDIEHFSTYVRTLVRKDIESSNSVSLREFSREYQVRKEYSPRKYADPPRKYSGFIAGLYKNSWVLNWFKNKSDQYELNFTDDEKNI